MTRGVTSGAAGDRERLAIDLEVRSVGAELFGSSFYRNLTLRMAADARVDGVVWSVLGPYAGQPFDDAYALRLLGGVHRLVLAGAVPELATHYPSTGGDGDLDAAWPAFVALLADPPASVLDALERPPQTNEVGRSAALVGGLLAVAADTGLPLRLRELGSSAGLNLRVDRYRYEQGGVGWGDPASPVRFADLWAPGVPPFWTPATIADRRGCDRDPIDAADPDAALTLLSYVWPGQAARFELLRAALEVAANAPVVIERADAPEWIARELADPAPGRATVVYHSVFWQYLPAPSAAAITETVEQAGAAASREAPLAWLRLEPSADGAHCDLRCTRWPGGEEVLLATAGFHGGPVTWLP